MVEVCEGAPVAVSGWVLADRHDLRPCAASSLHRGTIWETLSFHSNHITFRLEFILHIHFLGVIFGLYSEHRKLPFSKSIIQTIM